MPTKHQTNRYVHPLLRARDWQNRPQFEELCSWWRESSVGVCALVGIGGAGKTAIVDRFLQVLPGALRGLPEVVKNVDLAQPERLFVFSFYDAPNPDHFIEEVAVWLGYKSAGGKSPPPSYQQVLRMLEKAGRCLLVLDGLEKVQDDGARGGVFGQIADGRLSDLVLRLATGYLPDIAAVITTRFAIADLEEALYEGRTSLYRQISVEEISVVSGVQLLKKRGVRGGDAELKRIVLECGQHALTVDLAGGYLAEFEGGRADAPLLIGDIQEIEQVLRDEPDARRRAVLKQEFRFAKVAYRYRTALKERDPASLAIVERICLFRLGVSADTLIAIFTGAGKESISGPDLAALSAIQIRSKLQKLVQMRIFDVSSEAINPGRKSKSDPPEHEASGSSPARTQRNDSRYTVHPAVRDGFLKALDRHSAKQGHEAVRTALQASLAGKPGTFINDTDNLDLIEEIIHHSVEADHVPDAVDLFIDRMSAAARCLVAGDYSRMDRIARDISSAASPAAVKLTETLSQKQWGDVLFAWALAKLGLGQLSAAKACVEHMRTQESKDQDRALMCFFLEREALFLGGQLDKAGKASKQLSQLAGGADKAANLMLQGGDAFCELLKGNADVASHYFDAWDEVYSELDDSDRKHVQIGGMFFRGELRALFLDRLGKQEIARRLCEKALTDAEKAIKEEEDFPPFSEALPRLHVALAQCLQSSDIARSQRLLDEATEWAVLRDSKEILCWTALLRGRLKAAEAVASSEANRKTELLADARKIFGEGILIARECGFSLYHIDLLVGRAGVLLLFGDSEEATRDLRMALTDGCKPPSESGLPTLLAATDTDCGYAWGEGDARHLLGETLLLQAAQSIQRPGFTPGRFGDLPARVRDQIAAGEDELVKCLKLRKQIQDPKAAETECVLGQLKTGVLTTYPLGTILQRGSTVVQPQSKPGFNLPIMTRSKVFVSYSHKDAKLLGEFKTMLAPAIRKGTVELWDDTMIKPGAKWRDEIKAGIAAAKVAVLLVSPDFLASDFIAKNELPPLLKAAQDDGVTIFWVCLSSCLYRQTEIEQYQAAHDVGHPLDTLTKPERKATLKDICDKLLQAVSTL